MSGENRRETMLHKSFGESTNQKNHTYQLKEAILTPEKPQEAIDFREKLDELVFGQNKAKEAIVESLVGNIFPFNKEEGVLGSFIFTGPSGVGKTEIAQSTAEIALGDRNAFRKIKCNQLNSEIAAERLIGSSYIGDSTRPILNDSDLFAGAKNAINNGKIHPLIEILGAKNFSIVVFDEIEKAHPKIFDTLLTLLDKGQIELNSGKGEGHQKADYSKTTDLRNSLIIFTSNQGSEEEQKNSVGFLGEGNEDKQQNYLKHLKNKFKPEFLNRITKIVPFHNLGEDAYYFKINQISSKVSKELEDAFNISFKMDEELKKFILGKQEEESFEGEMRNIERFFHKYVERYLQYIISGGKLENLNIGAGGGIITAFWDKQLGGANFKIEYDENTIPEENIPNTSIVKVEQGKKEILPSESIISLHNGSFLETLNNFIIPNLKLLKILYKKREEYGGNHFAKSIEDTKKLLENLGFSEKDLIQVKKEVIAETISNYESLFQTYQGVKLVSNEEKKAFGNYYIIVKKYVEHLLKEKNGENQRIGRVEEIYLEVERDIREILDQNELNHTQHNVLLRIVHRIMREK